MARPSERTIMHDRIKATTDIVDKTYAELVIKKLTVANDSDVDMVLTFNGVDRDVYSGEVWIGDMETTSFSLDANGGAYRIDVEV